MFLLFPHTEVSDVCAIESEYLTEKGINTLFCDIDNTLVAYNETEPNERLLNWLRKVKESGISVILMSNNKEKRVNDFAEKIDCSAFAQAHKPTTIGLKRAVDALKLDKTKCAIVGDQILTDIIAGRLFGIHTILVSPIAKEKSTFAKAKRKIEKIILFFWKKKSD